MFQDPVWSLLDCPLPVMEQKLRDEQATKAFSYAETDIHSLELDAMLYTPILLTVCTELGECERSRVMRLLDILRAKGLTLVDRFQDAIELEWRQARGA
jgi:hypothetical protein